MPRCRSSQVLSFGRPRPAKLLGLMCALLIGHSLSSTADTGQFEELTDTGLAFLCDPNTPDACNDVVTNWCYRDDDHDGWGNDDIIADLDGDNACISDGEAWFHGDCNDLDLNAHPEATEIVGNDIDDDCDGVVSCWLDLDGDGWGVDLEIPDLDGDGACISAGEATISGDCADDSIVALFPGADPASIHPGAVELPADGLDQDCDGQELCYADFDGDGWAGQTLADAEGVEPETPWFTVNSADLDCDDAFEAWEDQLGDCDDGDPLIHPDAIDVWYDGLDQNCDGADDFDQDQDGVRLADGDCDDTNPDIGPDIEEMPGNTVDEDCSGTVSCFRDKDGDGFGNSIVIDDLDGDDACVTSGESTIDTDCDDESLVAHLRFPGNIEMIADGIDQDCDGIEICLTDLDNDGFGDDGSALLLDEGITDEDTGTEAAAALLFGDGETYGRTTDAADGDCSDEGEAYVWTAQDCDDNDPWINPAMPETWYDGVDQNCDGQNDFDQDLDGHLFGTTDGTPATDCNDEDPGIHPDVDEVVGNAVDENCDGQVMCFVDADQDGFGTDEISAAVNDLCETASSEATVAGDCHDDAPFAHPQATEIVGNEYDDDCDGWAMCYRDLDGDGWGTDIEVFDDGVKDAAGEHYQCNPDAQEATQPGDCHDDNASANPEGVEVPGNPFDDDCDGQPTCYQDLDGDGFGTTVINDDAVIVEPSFSGDAGHFECDRTIGEGEFAGDCDDQRLDTWPGATEVCDEYDNDCDGEVDEGCPVDMDLDGQRDDQDCDDTNPTVYDGAPEICDGLDNDCDGAADEEDTCGRVTGCTGAGGGFTWAVLLSFAPHGWRRRRRHHEIR